MRYPFLFRLLHWVLTGSMMVLLLTGLSLHAVAQPAWSLFDGRLPGWFWPGRINLVHMAAAVAFMPSLVAALAIFLRRPGARRVSQFVLLIGGVAMIATAMVLLNPLGPSQVYTVSRLIHGATAVVLLATVLWHAIEGLGPRRRLLVAAFHPWKEPRWRELGCFLPLPLVSACLVLNGLPMRPAWRDLVARRVSSLGSDPARLAWSEASPVYVELANGLGYRRGRTQVTLRAMHDGEELCVLAEWADPIENRRCMPWEKTAGGWKRLVTDEDDETVFYEDKFSLLFPTQRDRLFERFGCAVQCHAGGGRAYGYKCSDQIVDVWHWKSTRSDPVGQVDDQYWWKPDFSSKKVGRFDDPKTGGGYERNAAKGKNHPAFLPDDLAHLKQGIIPRAHAVPYRDDLAAKLPVETIIPGIVASPFEGDQGDVHGTAEHADGRWRLFIRRKLDTGSQYDVKFVPGGEHFFGCAAFDCASKRHAYDLTVYCLRLEP